MEPADLIRELVARDGGELAVARAMGDVKFQGTLYKFCHGQTRTPARRTAQRIAKHFDLPLEAIYEVKAAEAEAARLQLTVEPNAGDQVTAAPALGTREPAPSWPLVPWPLDPWISRAEWEGLTAAERAAIAWEARKALAEIVDAGRASGAAFGKRPRGGTL